MRPHYAAPYPPVFNPSDLEGNLSNTNTNTAGLFEQFNDAVLHGRICFPGAHDGPAWKAWNWANYWHKCFKEAMKQLREHQETSHTAPVDTINNSKSLENRVKDLEEMVSTLVTRSLTSIDTPPSIVPSTTTAANPTSSTPILIPTTTPTRTTQTESTTAAPTAASQKEPTPPSADPYHQHMSLYYRYQCWGCGCIFSSMEEIDMHHTDFGCPGSGSEETA